MLQLRNITKIYKTGSTSVTALKNISVDFPDKGLVFVVGKSGSGKSTLLNILGGLDKMNKGEIIINGKSTKDFSASDFDAYRNYHIGFIFQEFNLLEDVSVKENIALALKIQSKEHDETTIDEVLKIVNLEGLGYRSPKELSGGQKQRIAIARALIKNPDIILADEPTGALDSKTGYELMSSLKSLSLNKLVIVVTHDAEMANVFGDEIIKLNDGNIVDHLIVSPNYTKPSNEKINDKIIKISSGNGIESKELVNDMLNKDQTNYLCLISQPELLTLAFPETYEQVFKKEDLSEKFVSCGKELKEVKKENSKRSRKQKAKIRLKECFKMAFTQFSLNKGKLTFLIVFTIIAFSLLGFSSLFFTINNSDIIANTLSNNDLHLGLLEKYVNEGREYFDEETIEELSSISDTTKFELARDIPLYYTMSSSQSDSSFEMKYFRGVVECDGVLDLNFKMLEGKATFDEDSLANNEIIISDYAAFELRRTGYLGTASNGVYGVLRPSNLSEQINSTVMINETEYKIVGVFDTNYEKFLPLLVSETYVDEEEAQISSLDCLKSYYYAKIFAPKGFYGKYLEDNKYLLPQPSFQFSFTKIPLYDYDTSTQEIGEDFKYVDFSSANYSSIENTENYALLASCDEIWGEMPEELKDNQVILDYNWIRFYGFSEYAIIEKAVNAFNNNLVVNKMASSSVVDSIIYKDKIEVVAVVDFPSSINNSIVFSDKMAKKLNMTVSNYDQILFTLGKNSSATSKIINKLFDQNYRVLNIDGTIPTDTLNIESFQSVAMIAAIVITLFAVLFMFNYVSTSVKKRKKEIGILRATGARGRDVVKMFAIEEGMIALVVSLVSTLLITYFVSLVNSSLGNMDVGIQIISINVIHIVIFVTFILLFFILTTLIPVISIAKMKPIDAIRRI